MRIVILGGAGFLGSKLTKALLGRGYLENADGSRQDITELVVADQQTANNPYDSRLHSVTGDLTDPAFIEQVITAETQVVVHLAAVVSGEAESNFELGLQVNLYGTAAILERCRQLAKPPKVLFASSVAVFGGELPEVISDTTAPTPQSSYGTQKAMGELLISDYTRRGFIDGIALRFPTIVVRPGRPNAATSSFASSIIREPLQGHRAVCPVSAGTQLWILSPRQAIRSAIQALELGSSQLGSNRTLSLPGLTVSVEEMLNALTEVGGPERTALIDWQPDPLIQQIVGSWPSRFDTRRALKLGFTADAGMTEIIHSFITDDLEKPA